MDGPKKSLFEVGCRHQYFDGICVYNLLKDGKYRSHLLCQTKILAELQERAMTFVMKRLHKRTTIDPRNKPCDLYFLEYEGFPEEEHLIWEPSYKIPTCLLRRFVNSWFCPDHEAVLEADLRATCSMAPDRVGTKEESVQSVREKILCFRSGKHPSASASSLRSLW
jgi:hypothetical protein